MIWLSLSALAGGPRPVVTGVEAPPTTSPVAIDLAACDAGSGEHCLRVRSRIVEGDGLEFDGAAADRMAARACELGSAEGCAWAELAAFVEGGCAGERFDACYDLGLMRLAVEGPAEDSVREGIEALARGCDHGQSACCVALGAQYDAGDHVPRDLDAAVRVNSRACAAGHAVGCLNLADAHIQRRAYAEAQAALRRARDAREGRWPGFDTVHATLSILAGGDTELNRRALVRAYEQLEMRTTPEWEFTRLLAAVAEEPVGVRMVPALVELERPKGTNAQRTLQRWLAPISETK